jgi:sialate O-acetylesterase
MNKNFIFTAIIAGFLFSCSHKPAENIVLPKIFGDNMVLQRNTKINVFGTAEPERTLTVEFNGKSYAATTDKKGKWMIQMDSVEAGGPFEMKITGKKTITFTNVMVGEVWICSGQSNMQFSLSGDKNAATEVPNSKNPNIRLLMVDLTNSLTPKDSVSTTGWHECVPDSAKKFSAVGYYFAKNLQKDLNVPVGIIESAWGGSLVEAWVCADSLKKYDEFVPSINLMEKKTASNQKVPDDKILNKMYEDKVAIWEGKVKEILAGEEKEDAAFLKNVKTPTWPKMDLPRRWESTDIGSFDGIVWFVKDFTVPKKWRDKPLILKLGYIDDMDVTYVNGKKVGEEMQYNHFRKYIIPASEVMNKISIAVKAIDVGGGGGLYGPKNTMFLICKKDSLPVSGNWAYKVAGGLEKFPLRPMNAVAQQIPYTVYNAMIHPLIPYNIKGAVWYQGESSAATPYRYEAYLRTLINSWRTEWKNDLGFIIMQLENYNDVQVVPSESNWAAIRESMFKATQLKNADIVCIIDKGDAVNIHPTDKGPVGYRTALVALNRFYDKNIEYSGPRFKSFSINGNKVVILYDHIGKGLEIKNGKKLKGFAIAGDDKIFYWADAVLKDNTVIVSCKKVAKPVAVRYDWSDNPEGNLYNKDGLPAFPFRTDNWNGIKENLKTDLLINLEEIYK